MAVDGDVSRSSWLADGRVAAVSNQYRLTLWKYTRQ
jgi:hypothetical protein